MAVDEPAGIFKDSGHGRDRGRQRVALICGRVVMRTLGW